MTPEKSISLDMIRKLRQQQLGPDIDVMREDILRMIGTDLPDNVELLSNGVCDDCNHDKLPAAHERLYRHGSLNLCSAHLEPRLRVYARLQEAVNA